MPRFHFTFYLGLPCPVKANLDLDGGATAISPGIFFPLYLPVFAVG
jgi:hypothetical protein